MSTPPTYYKNLNTYRLSNVLAAILFLVFVAIILTRRNQHFSFFSDVIFGVSLLFAEFSFYVGLFSARIRIY